MTDKLKRTTVILAAAILSTTVAAAADYNPAKYQPTTASEIERGRKAHVPCIQRHYWLEYALCVEAVLAREPNPSDAFKLGLHQRAGNWLAMIHRTRTFPPVDLQQLTTIKDLHKEIEAELKKRIDQ